MSKILGINKVFVWLLATLLIISSMPLNAIAEVVDSSDSVTDYELISADTTISEDKTFDTDVIIAPNIRLSVQSGVTVQFHGDLVIYGTVANSGSIYMNGRDIFANYIKMGGMVLTGDSDYLNYGRFDPYGYTTNVGTLSVDADAYPSASMTILNQEETVSDASYTIKGQTIPGFSVLIDNEHTVTADQNGNFEWQTTLAEGENRFTLQVKNVFQRQGESKEAIITYDASSVPAPPAPQVEPLTDKQDTLKGTSEPEAFISVSKDGTEIANGQANMEGDFSIQIGKQAQGTQLSVTAENAQGKVSEPTVIQVTEANSTVPISDYELISSDTTISQDTVYEKTVVIAPNVRLSVQSGVTVNFHKDLVIYGSVSNHGKINMNSSGVFANYVNMNGMILKGDDNYLDYGRFEPYGQTTNVGTLSVRTDAYPLPSLKVSIPEEPVSDTAFTLKGQTIPWFSVVINNQYTVTADQNGNFEWPTAFAERENRFTLVARDVFQLLGEPQEVVIIWDPSAVPAPPAPQVEPLTDKQDTLKGTSEPAAFISVSKDGTEIANGQANMEGNFSIQIGKQAQGTTLSVTAENAQGKISEPTVVLVTEAEDLKIISTNPEQGGTLDFQEQNVSITFNYGNLQEGVSFEDIILKDEKGNIIPVGKGIMDKHLEIYFSDNLAGGTSYTLTIPAESVVGGNGESLTEAFILTFKTQNGTEFSGGIYESITWKKENSPYFVTGDVVVFPSATLTVEPGVEVQFDYGTKLSVRGTLVAAGTESGKIRLTSMQQNGRAEWGGIQLDQNHIGKATIDFVEISHADKGLQTVCCSSDYNEKLTVTNSSFIKNTTAIENSRIVRVSNSVFTENGTGIDAQEPYISHSTFSKNDTAVHGSYTQSALNEFLENQTAIKTYNGNVLNNRFIKNSVGLQANGTVHIERNTFDLNSTGLILQSEDDHLVTLNNFTNNSVHVQNNTTHDKTLANNWWGTTDEAAIKSKLLDGYQDIKKGMIIFKPFATEAFLLEEDIVPVWKQDAALPYTKMDNKVNLHWDSLQIKNHDWITGYKIIVNGKEHKVLGTEMSGYELTLPFLEQPYEIKVEARNFLGNWSTNGPSISVKVVDEYKPYYPAEGILDVKQTNGDSVTLSWPAAMDNDSIVNYRVFMDDELMEELPADRFSTTISDVKAGINTLFTVEAVDPAGHTGYLSRWFTLKDLISPTWSSDSKITVENTDYSSVRLSWPVASDVGGEIEYELYVNDQLYSRTLETTAIISDLDPGKTYDISIYAVDSSNNKSASALSIQAKTLEDKAPHWLEGSTIRITETNETLVPQSFHITWPEAKSRYELLYHVFLNGEKVFTRDSTYNENSYYFEGLKAGTSYTIAIKAVDETGRESTLLTRIIKTEGVHQERISGKTRYETSVEISKKGWEKADTVIIARGDNFPDALAGGPLAYQLDAPILLTAKDYAPASVLNEMKRLGAKKLIILGGTGAVSPNVEQEIKNQIPGIQTERISGKDRYETAVKIAERMNVNPDKIIVAYSHNFPDALSIAPFAARNGYPIVLSNQSSLSGATEEFLKKSTTKDIVIVGGEQAISNTVMHKIASYKKSVTRVRGSDRFATTAAIINKFNMNTEQVFIANGVGFADALTGSVLAAKNNAPLLLVKSTSLPSATKTIVEDRDIHNFTILGGKSAVDPNVIAELIEANQ